MIDVVLDSMPPIFDIQTWLRVDTDEKGPEGRAQSGKLAAMKVYERLHNKLGRWLAEASGHKLRDAHFSLYGSTLIVREDPDRPVGVPLSRFMEICSYYTTGNAEGQPERSNTKVFFHDPPSEREPFDPVSHSVVEMIDGWGPKLLSRQEDCDIEKLLAGTCARVRPGRGHDLLFGFCSRSLRCEEIPGNCRLECGC